MDDGLIRSHPALARKWLSISCQRRCNFPQLGSIHPAVTSPWLRLDPDKRWFDSTTEGDEHQEVNWLPQARTQQIAWALESSSCSRVQIFRSMRRVEELAHRRLNASDKLLLMGLEDRERAGRDADENRDLNRRSLLNTTHLIDQENNMNFRRLLDEIGNPLRPENLKRNRHRILPMLTVYPLLAAFMGSWLHAGAVTIGCIFLVDYTLQRYIGTLESRIAAHTGPTWDVAVSSVKVGTITDADYAAIRLSVFSDARPYYSQAINLSRVAYNSLTYCYQAFPLALFWMAVALAVIAPDTFGETVSAFQHANATEVKHALGEVASLVALTMAMVVIVQCALGLSRFGFINCFEEAVGTAVRQHCAVAAEGSIVLLRWTSEGPVFCDEVKCLISGADSRI
jgi:hypothetical protein